MKPISVMLRLIVVSVVVLPVWLEMPALAEVRTITATGEYRMGDNDTRTDAKRLALLDAKRLALEQAGVYIESITEVKNLDLAKEEIRVYTAGIVEVVEQATRTMMEGETALVRVDVKAKIDTDVIARQIEAVSQSRDLKTKLIEAESRTGKLQKELDSKSQELAAAKSHTESQVLSQQRRQAIARLEAEQLVENAIGFLISGKKKSPYYNADLPAEDSKKIRSLISQALILDPENSSAHGIMGILLWLDNRYQEAESSFRSALSGDPNSALYHGILGVILQNNGDDEGAAREFESALRLDPDNELASANYGGFLARKAKEDGQLSEQEKQRRYDLATKLIRNAIRQNPNNANWHMYLSVVLAWFKKDLIAASSEFRAGVRLYPPFLFSSGSLLLSLEDYEVLAAEESERRIRLEPGNAKYYWEYGSWLEAQGNREGAIPYYRNAYRLSDEFGYAAFFVGALAKAGQKQEASRVYHDYLKRHPYSEKPMKDFLREEGLLEVTR